MEWTDRQSLLIRNAQTGQPMKQVTSAVYLGGLVTADGTPKAAVARRIGEAKAIFDNLQTVWRHANITRQRKLILFKACVVSKLMYSLSSCCMNVAQLRRLDRRISSQVFEIHTRHSAFFLLTHLE